jgi:hypothetical protein
MDKGKDMPGANQCNMLMIHVPPDLLPIHPFADSPVHRLRSVFIRGESMSSLRSLRLCV